MSPYSEVNQLKVILCTPYRRGDLKHEFFFSVLDLVSYTLERKKYEINLGFSESTVIYMTRNELFFESKERGADYVLFVDSDTVFPADALEKLLNHRHDVVTGVYYQRHPPYFPVVFRSCNKTEPEVMEEIPSKPFRVSACGAGFLLISKKVLNMFDGGNAKKTLGHPFTPIINEDYNAMWEDISFCMCMERMGVEIWADPTIRIGHVAQSTVIYPEDYLGYQKHNQEEKPR